MAHFDVFNGDADGILALLQLRKHCPLNAKKITGIKRDIALLKRCDAAKGDSVTVLDVSMEKNINALNAMLDLGVSVFYADHHKSGDIPQSPLLDAHIDLDANTCTSLIVDAYLNGEYRLWAIAAAYGDNMIARADRLGSELGLSLGECAFLRELGTLINYNGYGASTDDLHYHPEDLFELLMEYESPFDLMEDRDSPYFQLKHFYEQDMDGAKSISPFHSDDVLAVYILPDDAASRRVSGVWGNELANRSPQKSHLVLTTNSDGSYTVSLRAPLNDKQGADEICSSFDTGGGRAGAAGINKLNPQDVDVLIERTATYYKK
ncbi:DHH family phosphoesterase [Enterovibrio makurazakiensis]|uniref:DHH family phosphoesterase n=1 Tax=Enterovibrio makurazakiensis TaxID=2910232 RepID=UPI003D19BE9A